MKKNITSIDCSALDTSAVVNMKTMFSELNSLTSLNVSGFDTSNVTDMMGMFFACDKLAKLDLSSFNTGNVTTMTSMFSECHALKELDIRGFNTCNVTDMSCMFYECNALSSVDVSGFDTHNVTGMIGMFCGCRALSSLDLSNFDTRNVTMMSGMFEFCVKLTDLDLSSFSTNKVELFSWFLNGCTALTYVDMSNFTVMSNAVIEEPAKNCPALQSVKCSKDVYEKFGFDETVKRVSLGLREYFIEGCSLDIDDGSFYLNIYTDFPADYKKYNVQITLPDGTNTTTEVGNAKAVEMNGKTYKLFPVNVAAKDIDSNIAVTVASDSGQKIGTVNMSVSEYAYALKNRNPEYSDFIDSMLNYGAYANAYFSGVSYNPALYTQNDFDEIREKCKTTHNAIDNSSYVGTSLLLKNQIFLRHYFKTEVTDAVRKGDLWYVEKAFNPTQFDETFGGYNYSIYQYLEKVLDPYSSMPAELKNLCCALYEYNQEALKLVNNN